MYPSVEGLKALDLVEFLSRHYGLSFTRQGAAYACRSPFTEEKTPSFFVRLVDGHWLFKDFSSGAGGSIFDFVQLKEGLKSFGEVLAFVRRTLFGAPMAPVPAVFSADAQTEEKEAPAYDVTQFYEQFRREDPDPCRGYLRGRHIAAELVEAMIGDGTVVHNRYQGRSYCCFAVRDAEGRLRCLDNHAVEGKGTFVLGTKVSFSLEWDALKEGREVFVTEGIIDYLSVKTLEESAPPGLALLGNRISFDPALVKGAGVIIAALDDDDGGRSGVLDLQATFPEKEIRIYDLEGHKDPNELLQEVRTGKGRKLSPERKLQLYREFQRSSNKAELARRWGIDRSYLYEVVRDCEEAFVQALSSRRSGRRPRGAPATLAEAIERIKELEARYEEEATAREEFYCRSELLAIRLKWAEIEAAELRGETVDEGQGPKVHHVKKKKSRKPS